MKKDEKSKEQKEVKNSKKDEGKNKKSEGAEREEGTRGSNKGNDMRVTKGGMEQRHQPVDENKNALVLVQVMDTDECEQGNGLSNNEGQSGHMNKQNVMTEQDNKARGEMQSRRRPRVTRKPMADVTNKPGNSRMKGKRKLESDTQGGNQMEIDEVEEQKPKMLKLGVILQTQQGATEACPAKPPQCK